MRGCVGWHPNSSTAARSHFLTLDDDGWALWGVDQDSDDPLLTFPPGPAGEERARSAFTIRSRETRRIRWLAAAAVAAAVTWLTLEVVVAVLERTTDGAEFEDDLLGGIGLVDLYERIPTDLEITLQAVGQVMETAFIVATGLYLVAWLHRRWRREG